MRFVYLGIAYLSLAIAFIGIILPGLPATEFLLIAAWAASKSSPRLHRWMLNHKLIGPPLRDWQDGRIIRYKTKLVASIMMVIAAIIMASHIQHLPSLIISLSGMSLGMIWMWRFPSSLSIENQN
jgi:hypothetical protein